MITKNGQVIGSELIGQNFTKPEYFQPGLRRPATTATIPPLPADSNYGPTNQKLIDRVKASVDKFHKDNPDYHGPDPGGFADRFGQRPGSRHQPGVGAGARCRAWRKRAAFRRDQLNQLVAQYTKSPDLGLLGEPRVNVLKLNLALDAQYPKKIN